jgi:histidinol-phosphatase (PHP family)
MEEVSQFSSPTDIRSGEGARSALADFAGKREVHRPLLVTDSGLVTTSAFRLVVDEMEQVWSDASAHDYWREHVTGSVADYVRAIEDAKAAGLPVLLGLELDWIPGRADDLRRFLEPYDWDIVLGSVHWLAAWTVDGEYGPSLPTWWDYRDVDEVFAEYASYLSDLAASGLCDVLAHADLPKLFGHRPTSLEPLHAAILDAATKAGCALEVNSNGYNKPVA